MCDFPKGPYDVVHLEKITRQMRGVGITVDLRNGRTVAIKVTCPSNASTEQLGCLCECVKDMIFQIECIQGRKWVSHPKSNNTHS